MAINTLKNFVTLLVLMTISSILSAATTNETLQAIKEYNDTNGEIPLPRNDQEASKLLRHIRFLASNYPRAAAMTCDKYPTVCGAKGSAGPYCCNKKCVNVMTDELNCGKCGKKCKYSEMCCQGKCVNPSNDEKNCGKCNNKCKKGSSCVYGLCSYA